MWAIGGGSHAAIVAVLYTRKACPALVTTLQQYARERQATVSFIERIPCPTHLPPYFHMHSVARPGTAWRLYDKADRYKHARTHHDPKQHPTYLSCAMLQLAKHRPVRLHTVLANLYAQSKVFQQPCFVYGVQKRQFYADGFQDLTFVLHG